MWYASSMKKLITSLSLRSLPIVGMIFCGLVADTVSATVRATSTTSPYRVMITNLEPYPVWYAFHYTTNRHSARTEGWWKLEPGQSTTITRDAPRDHAPDFYVLGHSADDDVIRWVMNLPADHPGILYFEGAPQDEVTFQNVALEVMDNEVPIGSKTYPNTGFELGGFVSVPLDESCSGTYIFCTYQFGGIIDPTGIDDRADVLDVCAERARWLGKSLIRQAYFGRTWPDPASSYPYDIGLGLADHNGFDYMGVQVTEVSARKTIFGDPMPFEVGDIIVGLNGTAVFHKADFLVLLNNHATDRSRGILVPVELHVMRGDELHKVRTTYFFNDNHWTRNHGDSEKAEAVAAGLAETVGLGRRGGALFEVGARNIGRLARDFIRLTAVEGDPWEDMTPSDYRNPVTETWAVLQENARLRQMYPEAFDAGAWLGFVTPSAPRLLFTRAFGKSLVKRGLSRTVASIGSSVTLEVAEGVIWTVGTAGPLQSTESTISDIVDTMPYSMVGGAMSPESLSRRRR